MRTGGRVSSTARWARSLPPMSSLPLVSEIAYLLSVEAERSLTHTVPIDDFIAAAAGGGAPDAPKVMEGKCEVSAAWFYFGRC